MPLFGAIYGKGGLGILVRIGKQSEGRAVKPRCTSYAIASYWLVRSEVCHLPTRLRF
jgi:hypothetical protein